MNNSLAFGVSQHWNWQILVLLVCALGTISLVALVVAREMAPAPARARRLTNQVRRPDCAA